MHFLNITLMKNLSIINMNFNQWLRKWDKITTQLRRRRDMIPIMESKVVIQMLTVSKSTWKCAPVTVDLWVHMEDFKLILVVETWIFTQTNIIHNKSILEEEIIWISELLCLILWIFTIWWNSKFNSKDKAYHVLLKTWKTLEELEQWNMQLFKHMVKGWAWFRTVISNKNRRIIITKATK